jgi:hypothetical protein
MVTVGVEWAERSERCAAAVSANADSGGSSRAEAASWLRVARENIKIKADRIVARIRYLAETG